jgi:hypothetical protein
LGVRVTSSGRQNTAPGSVPINDHRNISLVKERVKLRPSFARAAMRVIERVGSREIDLFEPKAPTSGPRWLHEIKHDARLADLVARALCRNGLARFIVVADHRFG